MLGMVGAIDIGSNAVRFLLAVSNGDHFKTIVKKRIPLQLGKQVYKYGFINDSKTEELINTLIKFKKITDDYSPSYFGGVATAAMRESKNGAEIIRKINKLTKFNIKIIDGNKEAELVYSAVKRLYPSFSKTDNILIDIGGGSLEVSIAAQGSLVSSASFKVGTIRLNSQFKNKKLSNIYFKDFIKEEVEHIGEHINKSKTSKNLILIGTGGNFEALGKIGTEFYSSKNTNSISKKTLNKILNDIEGKSKQEKMQLFKLKEDRADVIYPACIIIKNICEKCNIEEVKIPHIGLKEGLILNLLEKEKSNTKVTKLIKF